MTDSSSRCICYCVAVIVRYFHVNGENSNKPFVVGDGKTTQTTKKEN